MRERTLENILDELEARIDDGLHVGVFDLWGEPAKPRRKTVCVRVGSERDWGVFSHHDTGKRCRKPMCDGSCTNGGCRPPARNGAPHPEGAFRWHRTMVVLTEIDARIDRALKAYHACDETKYRDACVEYAQRLNALTKMDGYPWYEDSEVPWPVEPAIVKRAAEGRTSKQRKEASEAKAGVGETTVGQVLKDFREGRF